MGMFIVLLGVFAIILTATCSAFGIALPEPESKVTKKDNSFFKDNDEAEYLESVADYNRGYHLVNKK